MGRRLSKSIGLSIASDFTSGCQKTRVLTEAWLGENGYCLQCNSDTLLRAKANRKVCDFTCPRCAQTYELKGSLKRHTSRVVDGDHDAMMERIQATDVPTLMLLQYATTPLMSVTRLMAVHPVFMTPLVIEKRNPTWPKGRSQPWVGCNIRLDRIPEDGKIVLVGDGHAITPKSAREKFLRSARFKKLKPEARGWTALVLTAVRSIAKKEFDLAEVTAYEKRFSDAYPMNRHVAEKVRQQLQMLRALGYLERVGPGRYRVLR